jgi:hypothetical protein
VYDECVVAVYDGVEQARLAVHILNRSDFPTQHVSMVTAHLEDERELEAELNYGDDSIRDAFVGAGLGSVCGMLTGTSLVALVGGGFALFAGPLAGLATGAVVGGLLGGMGGSGVHKRHLPHYEKLVNQGHPLVIARGTPLEVAEAHRLLKQTAFKELHFHTKTDDDAPEVMDLPKAKSPESKP